MITCAEAMRRVLEALAAECGCRPADFGAPGVHLFERPVEARTIPRARRYLPHDPAFVAISMGHGAVVSASRAILPDVATLYRDTARDDVFQPARLASISARLAPHGLDVYGPVLRLVAGSDTLHHRPAPAGFEIVVEVAPSVQRMLSFDAGRWPNAISPRRTRKEMAIARAEHGGETAGIAAISRDSEYLWQIGIDVAEEHRNHGLGAALTAALAQHALDAGRVPWYGVAPSNLASIRTALAAGFRLAWTEVFTSASGR